MTRSMVRWTMLALLGGALLTVAMAWGVIIARSLHGPRNPFPDGGLGADDHPWAATVPASWPKRCARWNHEVGFGIDHVSCSAARTRPSAEGETKVVAIFNQEAHVSGWPFRALVFTVNTEIGTSLGASAAGRTETRSPHIPWQDPLRIWGPLPLVPIWSGFIGDTLLNALAIALLIAPIKCVRHSRRARGRCMECGHLLHTLTTCPECGAVAGAPAA